MWQGPIGLSAARTSYVVHNVRNTRALSVRAPLPARGPAAGAPPRPRLMMAAAEDDAPEAPPQEPARTARDLAPAELSSSQSAAAQATKEADSGSADVRRGQPLELAPFPLGAVVTVCARCTTQRGCAKPNRAAWRRA
jgi:hypothetical protein